MKVPGPQVTQPVSAKDDTLPLLATSAGAVRLSTGVVSWLADRRPSGFHEASRNFVRA